MAFYLWECLDKDRAQTYLDNILKEDINILKFICTIARKWTSDNNDSGWDFPLDKYLTYISKDTIYEKIQAFDKRQLDTLNWLLLFCYMVNLKVIVLMRKKL